MTKKKTMMMMMMRGKVWKMFLYAEVVEGVCLWGEWSVLVAEEAGLLGVNCGEVEVEVDEGADRHCGRPPSDWERCGDGVGWVLGSLSPSLSLSLSVPVYVYHSPHSCLLAGWLTG